MPEKDNFGTSPETPGASSDFFLGQMAQSIRSLRDDMAMLRQDLQRMSESYATRDDLEHLKHRVSGVEDSHSQLAEANAGRKWIDRGIVALLGIASSGALLTALDVIKPSLIN